MNWQQAKAQARRLVDEAIVSGSAMNLTEYQSKDRYEIDHPNDRPMGAHNAVVRAAPAWLSQVYWLGAPPKNGGIQCC
jgi:hypothetical protein